MRVLFLSEYYPFNLRTDVFGVFMRMRMLLDAVSSLGDLDVLFFAPPGVDSSVPAAQRLQRDLQAAWGLRLNVFVRAQEWAATRPVWKRLSFWLRCVGEGAVAYQSELSLNNSHTPSLQAVAQCLERRPDLIVAFRLGTMAPLLRLKRGLPPIFFDLDDVEHVRALRTARAAKDPNLRARSFAAVPILWWSEYRAMALARRTFVASSVDLQRLKRFPRHQYRVAIPNAIRIPPPERVSPEATLLYLGNYIYEPNVEAAEYLIREVWPLVCAGHPDARLLIAGAEPDRIPSRTERPAGVEFLGFVDDLEALYRRTRVVCCAVMAGSGTRIKILEAAAHGKPIVSTTVGAEGIKLREGEEIFLRDDPASFAAACVRLLGNSSLSERMGGAARRAIAARYDRDIVIAKIRESVMAMLQVGGPTG